jgi:hypothetical protein
VTRLTDGQTSVCPSVDKLKLVLLYRRLKSHMIAVRIRLISKLVTMGK